MLLPSREDVRAARDSRLAVAAGVDGSGQISHHCGFSVASAAARLSKQEPRENFDEDVNSETSIPYPNPKYRSIRVRCEDRCECVVPHHCCLLCHSGHYAQCCALFFMAAVSCCSLVLIHQVRCTKDGVTLSRVTQRGPLPASPVRSSRRPMQRRARSPRQRKTLPPSRAPFPRRRHCLRQRPSPKIPRCRPHLSL